MNATNNGYLGFEKVRIPRENMLMKNAQVLEVRNAVMWKLIE
jgi:acyl-CoA oxidase